MVLLNQRWECLTSSASPLSSSGGHEAAVRMASMGDLKCPKGPSLADTQQCFMSTHLFINFCSTEKVDLYDFCPYFCCFDGEDFSPNE